MGLLYLAFKIGKSFHGNGYKLDVTSSEISIVAAQRFWLSTDTFLKMKVIGENVLENL